MFGCQTFPPCEFFPSIQSNNPHVFPSSAYRADDPVKGFRLARWAMTGDADWDSAAEVLNQAVALRELLASW